MRLERLLAIVIVLLGRGAVTAAELAERFEVSRRTIYRDVEALAQAGLPVVTTQGAGGGISLMENYYLDRSLFGEQERVALLLSLESLSATAGLGVEDALDKVRALFKGVTTDDWIRVEFAPWGSGRAQAELLATIRNAVLQRRLVHFDYVGAEGAKSIRTVEPMTILYRGSAWYLWGFCRLRQGFRLFRFSRIQGLRVEAAGFARRSARLEDAGPAGAIERPQVALVLRFHPQAAQRVYDDYDEGQIRLLSDGSFLVVVTYPQGEWIYGHLLSHGPLVQVLWPAWVRGVLLDRARVMVNLYAGEGEPAKLLSYSPSYTEGKKGRLISMQSPVERVCQSCGMPMADEKLLGTEADGSPSQLYCTYCYQKGAFTTDETMEQMIETCVPHLVNDGIPEAEARKMLHESLPHLKRWQE